jgi:V8-like Glu-specific endopeptidase
VKGYFRRYVECINLEQNAETERFSSNGGNGRSQIQSGSARETKLKITKIESNGGDVVRIELEKPTQINSVNQIGETTFVNLNTENNITYSKGFVVSR